MKNTFSQKYFLDLKKIQNPCYEILGFPQNGFYEINHFFFLERGLRAGKDVLRALRARKRVLLEV